MTVTNLMKMLTLVALMAAAAGSASAGLIINGDFQTGDLTGWTVFTTSNGSNGSGLPNVVSFDTTGSGTSLAAHFNVGEVNVDSTQQGGGLFQSVVLAAGNYAFSANVAGQDSPVAANSEAGVFSVLIDGVQKGSVDLGFVLTNDTLRGTLTASFAIGSPGSHEVRIQITRPFLNGLGNTPEQYVDNVSLISAVPEPSTISLLGMGAAVLALRRFLP